ncbi:MAG: hypothetical protein ACLUAO_05115 [Streptococcus sp.]
MELAVTLSVNVWNGQTTLQLMLEDARVDGVQLFDFRSKIWYYLRAYQL